MGGGDRRDVSAVFVAQPNFLGAVEELEPLIAAAREHGALVVCSADPISLGILEAPGELGVDVCVGEGQTLGNRLDFGGPSFGFFAAREEHLRRMPGRIAGETGDVDGRRGFVLTLQTREQHIRREKATSNICTAQALNALAGVVYLSLARAPRDWSSSPSCWCGAPPTRASTLVGARRRHGAARAAGGARVRGLAGPAPTSASVRRVIDALRSASASTPATRSAATIPSTPTGCSSRSPSSARARTSTASPTCSAAPSPPSARPLRREERRREHETAMQRDARGDDLREAARPGGARSRRPPLDVPERPLDELIPAAPAPRASRRALPEVSEPELVRHYVRLSRRNFDLDSGFYPLGSCTMKHNPRLHERVAALPGPRPPASADGPGRARRARSS